MLPFATDLGPSAPAAAIRHPLPRPPRERGVSGTPTRFRDWSRGPALAVLFVTAAALLWCLGVALTQETVPTHDRSSHGDAEFYREVVARVHAGQGYYDAVEDGLRQRGYRPHSVFNWRLPVYAWLFGKLPDPVWGHAILLAGVLATLLWAYGLLRHDGGPRRAAAAVVLLLGPLLWALFPDVVLFTELWAGMLITLSLLAYARGRPALGVGAGLLALFFRELALPYALLGLTLACARQRYREAAAWIAGLGLYGIVLMLHAHEVTRRLTPGAVVGAQAWLQWQGTAFVLLTCQINFYLLQAPAWLTALYLPLALLGLASWRSEAGGRAALTAGAYVAAFFVVGLKPHNAYWGLVDAPLLALGLVWTPAALRDLVAAILCPTARGSLPLRAGTEIARVG